MLVLMSVLGVLSLWVTAYVGYYLYIFLSGMRKSTPLPDTSARHRLAVVVPARNEAAVIWQLIDSLHKQDYPSEYYDIYVLANNCTDQTEEIARAKGATVVSAPEGVKSKGDALEAFFRERYLSDEYDAYVLFDADNLVKSDFLSIANRVLAAGYSGMMGFRDSKNPNETGISASYTIMYYLLNRLYNQPRRSLDMNAMISGTGFMLSKEHLKSLGGWKTYSLIEDAEITVQSSLHSQMIRYEPTARFYDEQVSHFLPSWHQRLRWSVGSQQNMRRYGLDCLISSLRREGKDSFDQLMMLLSTYMHLVSVLVFGLTLTIGLIAPERLGIPMGLFLASSFVGLIAFPTILSLVVLYLEDIPLKKMWKGVLTFWLFMLSWTPINLAALFRKQIRWTPIRHSKAIGIDDLTKGERM